MSERSILHIKPLRYPIPRAPSRDSIPMSTFLPALGSTPSFTAALSLPRKHREIGVMGGGPLDEVVVVDDSPVSVELEPICSETQFDRVIAEAHQLEESVVVVWMASWCRKCIYLKPKLEKLAADYYPRLRFYRVDVNSIPHRLVARAGVTKMPTIQLWRDVKKQAEVIGSHKAYLVVNEVREMIDNEYAT